MCMGVICKADYVIKNSSKNYHVKRGSKGIVSIVNGKIYVKLLKTEKGIEINKSSFVQRDFLDIKDFRAKWKIVKKNSIVILIYNQTLRKSN